MLSYLFRFVLIFAAISIARSVIMAIVAALRGPKTPPRAATPQETGMKGEGSTLLHQDPVCGTYVAAASSLRKISGGKVYHFCSEKCRDSFK